MRCVWSIPVGRCMDAHFAVYPEKLIETPIKAGCPEGGTVLDPFCGAGTTGIVCERWGRAFLGIDLNPAYVEIAERRIREARESGKDKILTVRAKRLEQNGKEPSPCVATDSRNADVYGTRLEQR